jgi:hypothetical protein
MAATVAGIEAHTKYLGAIFVSVPDDGTAPASAQRTKRP